MSKKELLNNLFEKWMQSEQFNCFVKDGIFDERVYCEQEIKLLYVLRDPHIELELLPKSIDLCTDLLKEPQKEWRTWNNPVRWTGAIMGDYSYEKIENVTAEVFRKQLGKVAIINIRKNAGGKYSNPNEITSSAKTYGTNLWEEITICDPDIIIACGTYDELLSFVIPESKNEKEIELSIGAKRFCKTTIKGKEVPIFEYRHPGQGCNKQKSFSDMKTIRLNSDL